MIRLIPYSIPMLFSLLFMGLAHTNWLWLAPLLIYLTGPLTTVFGEFSLPQLVAEYDFFHHSRLMSHFKMLNGFFFVVLNVWSFFLLASNPLPLWQLVVFIYGMIILNSNFSISLAHDLMHSPYRLGRWLSMIILLQNGFFYLEADHLYIHHRHVGTVHDPATARLGESIYRYLIRSVNGRMRMLFGQDKTIPTEKRRELRRASGLKAGICLVYLGLGALQNGQVFSWILCQFIFVILIYESITYIQHYAVKRERQQQQYEPVKLHHAWNSFYKLNTYLYFMMPVHSLHHVYEPDLTQIWATAGPRMPLPFARMLLTAYRPNRWFMLMDKQALALRTVHQSIPQ